MLAAGAAVLAGSGGSAVLWIANPLYASRKVSLRVRNFNTHEITEEPRHT